MVNNEKYIRSIHQILVSDQQWSHPEIKAVACFAWALSLRQLYISQHPCAPGKLSPLKYGTYKNLTVKNLFMKSLFKRIICIFFLFTKKKEKHLPYI